MSSVDADSLALLFLVLGGLLGLTLWASGSRLRTIVASAGLVLFVIALLARIYTR